MKKYIQTIILGTFLIGLIFAQSDSTNVIQERSITPTVAIRYDNFLQDLTPSSTIGILLRLDEDRYTGFDTTADEVRIIAGWRWTMLGVGTKVIEVDGEEQTVGQYTFGAKYKVMENMYTSTEYVRVDHDSIDDFIRLTVAIEF